MNKKNILFIFAVLIGVLFFSPAPQLAFAGAEIEVLEYSTSTEPVRAGEAVILTITFQNNSAESLPAGEDLVFLFTWTELTGAVLNCQTTAVLQTALPAGASRVFEAAECAFTPQTAGEASLKIALEDQPLYETTFQVEAAASALPAEIGQLFATLGLFAAMMAIMAVGTEVVIDSMRVALGMKKKVTALESLNKLKEELPGKLSDLGASAVTLEDLNEQIDRMSALVAKPADLAGSVAAIRDGEFGQFLETARAWVLDAAQEPLNGFVDQLKNFSPEEKEAVKGYLQTGLQNQMVFEPAALLQGIAGLFEKVESGELDQQLADRFHRELEKQQDKLANQLELLAGAQQAKLQGAFQDIRARLQTAIDTGLNLPAAFQVTLLAGYDAAVAALDQAITNLDFTAMLEQLAAFFQPETPKLLRQWLETQPEALIQEQHGKIKGLYDQQVRPLLSSMGIGAQQMGELESGLAGALNMLSVRAGAVSQVYVDGVKNLLSAVEKRRNDMQSPARKAWRVLRNSSFPAIPALVWAAISIAILALRPLANAFAPAAALLLELGIVLLVLILSLIWGMRLKSNAARAVRKAAERIPGDARADLREALRHSPAFSQQQRKSRALLTLLEDISINDSPDGNKPVDAPMAAANQAQVTLETLYDWVWDVICKWDPKNCPETRGWKPWHYGIGDLIHLPERLLNIVARREYDGGQVAEDILDKLESLQPTNLAAILQERDDTHRDQEASRLRWLRVISVFVGIGLAYLLNVDAADLLTPLLPDIAATLNIFEFNPKTAFPTMPLPPKAVITPGIILTGMAASAGSAFWHDQLDRLQAAKKGAESTAQLLNEIRNRE